MSQRRVKLSRVLDDLKQSERQLRAAIQEVERLLAAELETYGDGDPTEGGALSRGLREEVVPYDSRVEERGELYGWKLAPAVLHLLQRANGIVSNAVLIALLESKDFQFESMNHDVAVAQCLDRLKDHGRVVRIARGRWKLAERLDAPP